MHSPIDQQKELPTEHTDDTEEPILFNREDDPKAREGESAFNYSLSLPVNISAHQWLTRIEFNQGSLAAKERKGRKNQSPDFYAIDAFFRGQRIDS